MLIMSAKTPSYSPKQHNMCQRIWKDDLSIKQNREGTLPIFMHLINKEYGNKAKVVTIMYNYVSIFLRSENVQ